MANDAEVKYIPMQRNAMDAAIELCKMYFDYNPIKSVEQMQEIFLKFYAVADKAYHGELDLKQYLPGK